MSSHQNSTFNGESALGLSRPGLSGGTGTRCGPRLTRPKPGHGARRVAQAPDEIWGHYNNYRSNGVVMSAIIHVVLLSALLSGVFFRA